MYEKVTFAMYKGYSKAKTKFLKILEEEHGMETLETIILIVVAVIIAGILINFLTKEGFTNASTGEECGLIEYIFSIIKDKLDAVFNASPESGT